MHRAGVCHRDLKLENLVLDANFNLQVIDFNLACELTGSDGSGYCNDREVIGTPNYMAPEILIHFSY